MIINLPIKCRTLAYVVYFTLLALNVLWLIPNDYRCVGTVGDMNCGYENVILGLFTLGTFLFSCLGTLFVMVDLHDKGKLPEFKIKCRCANE